MHTLPAEKRERLQHRLRSLRTQTAGLSNVIGAFLDAAEPLAPLGAQLLWVAQPALGLFISRDAIDDLASVLDAPTGVAWLRAELTGEIADKD
jgi:hypothetical protein